MSYKEYIDQSYEEFDAANLLFDKEFYREAVSRAYYSMFHLLKPFSLSKISIRKVIKESYKSSEKNLLSQVF